MELPLPIAPSPEWPGAGVPGLCSWATDPLRVLTDPGESLTSPGESLPPASPALPRAPPAAVSTRRPSIMVVASDRRLRARGMAEGVPGRALGDGTPGNTSGATPGAARAAGVATGPEVVVVALVVVVVAAVEAAGGATGGVTVDLAQRVHTVYVRGNAPPCRAHDDDKWRASTI